MQTEQYHRGGLRLFDELDFSKNESLPLLARTLAGEKVIDWAFPTFYETMKKKGLLDSEVFINVLVRAVRDKKRWDSAASRVLETLDVGTLNADLLKQAGFDDFTAQFMHGVWRGELGVDSEIDESNAIMALTRFIRMDADDWMGASDSDLRIREAFAEGNTDNKDAVMAVLRKMYEENLKTRGSEKMPDGVQLLVNYMHEHGGAGPLTQIEAFLDYCGELCEIEDDEIKAGTRRLEDRIKSWDNITKSNFYATAAEVMRADKGVYEEFLGVFNRIESEKDFKVFAQEIFPLYKAKLALLREYDDYSDGVGGGYQKANYRGLDREKLRNDLHNALIPFTFDEVNQERREEGLTLVKKKIFGEITELFKDKFGILPEAVPKELSKEGMRSVENMVLYLSNVARVDESKKDLIGFYLALQLAGNKDGKNVWDEFRSGKACDPLKYLTPEAARVVTEMIERSRVSDPITLENTNIKNLERLADFKEALQDNTSEIRMSNVLTIDLMLQNLAGNIRDLADPDLYDTPMDRAKAQLISEYSPKDIGRVATALWHRAAEGKELNLNNDEMALAGRLEEILTENNLGITPDNINKYLQKGFKELGPIANTLSLIRERNVDDGIAELQSLLMPSNEVATIFGELGEEFRSGSSVFALNADLSFLESVVEKGEKSAALGEDVAERQRKVGILREYLGQIKTKMESLEAIYEEIARSFSSIREPNSDGNAQMIEKIREIKNIVNGNGGSDSRVITTYCSHDMNDIIENMRACLSCKTKGINNDTNLTLGDVNEFYLYSSFSDEIVYFVPTVSGDGEQRMSFVMDKVYGMRNNDILQGHIGVLAKKARALKDSFKEVPISILVTSASASSCSQSIESEGFLAELREMGDVDIRLEEGVSVFIPKSGFGDHYVEIDEGQDYRSNVKRVVSGVEIVLN